MSKVSIYVQPKLKNKMLNYDLNWSKIAQDAFEKAIIEEQSSIDKRASYEKALQDQYGPRV